MDLKSKIVIEYFKKICRIPRPSGKEEQIIMFLSTWAKENNYTCIIDNVGNMIIDCPGRKGYENKKMIIFQAHLDMVCVSKKGFKYNEETDSIEMIESEEYIYAKGTSLGGDDGIGIAIAQYIADKVEKRGPIRLIFTVDEETATIGAKKLDEKYLTSDYLINLDSEVSDEVIVSSAGCMEIFGEKNFIENTENKYNMGCSIILEGLCGGHSGDDINKNRLNAVIGGGIILKHILNSYDNVELTGFHSGTASNAISSSVEISFNTDDVNMIKKQASVIESMLKKAFNSEIDLKITVKEEKCKHKTMDIFEIISFLLNIPDGVISMSKNIDDLVGLSSNLGVFNADGNHISFNILIRGEIEEDIICTAEEIRDFSNKLGYFSYFGELTPSWPADKDSTLVKKNQYAYKKVTGEELKAFAIHSALECSEFRAKNKKIQMISISPDVYDVHSYNEKIYIPSIKKIINVLEELLLEV